MRLRHRNLPDRDLVEGIPNTSFPEETPDKDCLREQIQRALPRGVLNRDLSSKLPIQTASPLGAQIVGPTMKGYPK